MLKRLMQYLFAALVALAFGALPTLALASDATTSPPVLVILAPEVARVSIANEMNGPLQGSPERASPAALVRYSYETARPDPVLLN